MSALVVIPARYGSTRFPGKPLAPIKGKPLVQHVYERAKRAKLADKVVVATDDKRILDAVISFGGNAVMTSKKHPSGTDRAAEAASKPGYGKYDIIVNVQGDEPLIRPSMVDAVIRLLDDGRASIGTLAVRTNDPREALDPNAVKVVFDKDGFALYFSRSPIPFDRNKWTALRADEIKGGSVYKHIGIYSFKRDALYIFISLRPSLLEKTERLEQLRAFEAGMRIKVGITRYETIGVDTPEDIKRVEKCLNLYS